MTAFTDTPQYEHARYRRVGHGSSREGCIVLLVAQRSGGLTWL